MIISPPFLPAHGANQTDDAWLDAAMVAPPSRLQSTGAPEGSFPLSNKLEWHNGIHLQGQAGANAQTVVRAIADGKVVYVNKPTRANNNADDAQNFNPFGEGATWTDNGCIIVKHMTEIGAVGEQATEIVYYSVYMHLNEIGQITPAGQTSKRTLQEQDPVWRKDEIGKAGKIYGHAGQAHLEICMDETNLALLIGRPPAWVDPANITAPTADGRTDSVFGTLWFYLPASTPSTSAEPANHLRSTSQTTMNQAIWLKMTYVSGACTFESYDNAGRSLGALPAQSNAEYNLYAEARRRHNSLPQSDRNGSSPSGWYELLRFGRNLGRGPAATDKDPLPANAAHWRRIPGVDGQPIWADLNAEGTYKFSDADFLPIQGWNFVNDDSASDDQRCDSSNLKNLIADPDTSNQNRMEAARLASRLCDREVARKLRRMVCRFPSEWSQTTIETRYGFVKELDPFKKNPDAWKPMAAHLKAISFNDLPKEYIDADWRFHPREFIGYMQQCGWLSKSELIRCIPLVYLSNNGNKNTPVVQSTISTTTARSRVADRNPFVFMSTCRKYGLTNKIRLAHFLAQVYQETGVLQWTQELASGSEYEGRVDLGNTQVGDGVRFKGRGLIQTTGRTNYGKYSDYRGKQGEARYTSEPSNLLLAKKPFEISDTACLYWVSRDIGGGRINISRIADIGKEEEQLRSVTRNVNGQEDALWTGLVARRSHLKVLSYVLLDQVSDISPEKERRDV